MCFIFCRKPPRRLLIPGQVSAKNHTKKCASSSPHIGLGIIRQDPLETPRSYVPMSTQNKSHQYLIINQFNPISPLSSYQWVVLDEIHYWTTLGVNSRKREYHLHRKPNNFFYLSYGSH